jgi:hypothetical protein
LDLGPKDQNPKEVFQDPGPIDRNPKGQDPKSRNPKEVSQGQDPKDRNARDLYPSDCLTNHRSSLIVARLYLCLCLNSFAILLYFFY